MPSTTNTTSLPVENPNARVDQAVAEERARWTRWLASTGYGIDFANDINPPCTGLSLAAAYVQAAGIVDAGMTAADWLWCLQENTGAFAGERAPEPEAPAATNLEAIGELLAIIRPLLTHPVNAVLFDGRAVRTLRNGYGWDLVSCDDPTPVSVWADNLVGDQGGSTLLLAGETSTLVTTLDLSVSGAPAPISLTFRLTPTGLSLVVRPVHHV